MKTLTQEQLKELFEDGADDLIIEQKLKSAVASLSSWQKGSLLLFAMELREPGSAFGAMLNGAERLFGIG